MKSFLRLGSLLLSFVFASSIAFAQGTSTQIPVRLTAPPIVSTGLPLPPGPVLVGVPVSYQGFSQHSQILADGTRISQKTGTSAFCRDSAGRIRWERASFGLGLARSSPIFDQIEILDPVAGVQYIINPLKHMAYRFPYTARPQSERKTQSTPPPLPPPDPRRPQISRVPLGTQVMVGVTVEGERITTTFPEGSVGNDHPFARTCDEWRALDLKITVLYSCTDPRSGDSETRLTNIVRAEPDPSLFQPPPDYTILDGPANGRLTWTVPSPQR